MKLSIQVQGIVVKGDESGISSSIEGVSIKTTPSRKYTDVTAIPSICVSSSCHYFIHIRWRENGKPGGREYTINDGTFLAKPEHGYEWNGAPAYLRREVDARVREVLLDPSTKFYEYDRDGNQRYEGLRYHDPEYARRLAGVCEG